MSDCFWLLADVARSCSVFVHFMKTSLSRIVQISACYGDRHPTTCVPMLHDRFHIRFNHEKLVMCMI